LRSFIVTLRVTTEDSVELRNEHFRPERHQGVFGATLLGYSEEQITPASTQRIRPAGQDASVVKGF
jgi:hypothetical protein